MPYFDWLDFDFKKRQPSHIAFLKFSSESGKYIVLKLPLGGFGVSRFALDFELYKKAISQKYKVLEDVVHEAHFQNYFFQGKLNSGKNLTSKVENDVLNLAILELIAMNISQNTCLLILNVNYMLFVLFQGCSNILTFYCK